MNMRKMVVLAACLVTSSFAFSAQNYIQDPQFTEYRSNKGKSDFWSSHENSAEGLGDVGSSKDSAFLPDGSSRIRFRRDDSEHDFSAKPGLSQIVTHLPAYTNMTYSLYYCDKKGYQSQSQLHFGVRRVTNGALLAGDVIVEARVHSRDLNSAPQGDNKTCFRQVSIDFNTGKNTEVEIFSLMEIDTTDKPDLSQELEVRVDEFSLIILNSD